MARRLVRRLAALDAGGAHPRAQCSRYIHTYASVTRSFQTRRSVACRLGDELRADLEMSCVQTWR
eukprot:5680374-Pleurochrysis_carterae.AAC.1